MTRLMCPGFENAEMTKYVFIYSFLYALLLSGFDTESGITGVQSATLAWRGEFAARLVLTIDRTYRCLVHAYSAVQELILDLRRQREKAGLPTRGSTTRRNKRNSIYVGMDLRLLSHRFLFSRRPMRVVMVPVRALLKSSEVSIWVTQTKQRLIHTALQ